MDQNEMWEDEAYEAFNGLDSEESIQEEPPEVEEEP